jgi:hypothetical protein
VNLRASSSSRGRGPVGRYCPTWDVTSAFIKACGASEADLRPLWDKAAAIAQKGRSTDRRQRERTRAAGSPGPRPGRQGQVRDLVPGEPSPHRADTAAQYVRQLRALRAWAGQPGYKTILQRNAAIPRDIPRSTMYDALNPARTRLPALEVVQAIVRACASPAAAEAWTVAWRALRLREFEQDNPRPPTTPPPLRIPLPPRRWPDPSYAS